LRYFIAFGAIAIALAGPARGAEDFLGTAIAVSDGDTFDIKTDTRTVRIRLCGVDSPERSQPGYGDAPAPNNPKRQSTTWKPSGAGAGKYIWETVGSPAMRRAARSKKAISERSHRWKAALK
jgi:endonuclease YncB( thermonuclease family)